MKKIRGGQSGRKGMNRDTHPSNLTEQEYRIAFNANYSSFEGDGLPMLQNEPSNVLCWDFGSYKVVGTKYDLNNDRTYYFLTDPVTGISKIGYIQDNTIFEEGTDVLAQCGCDTTGIFGQALEDVEQNPYCEFTELVSDPCNLCLNFSIDHPIHYIELKEEKCGRRLYWTDNYNPPRYLDLGDLDRYSYIGQEVCGEENPPTCMDCEKLRVFPRFQKPCLKVENIEFGGNLAAGTYEFLLAYSDPQGNEVSQYYSLTQPASIFDKNNVTLDQTQLAYESSFGIRLSVDCLDPRYSHYKVAVIQRADVNNATSYFIEGVHPINDTTILYTTSDGKSRITLQELSELRTVYEKSAIMTSANGYLFQAGLTAAKEVNLQPIANLLGGFLRWNTAVSKEDLYEDGAAASKHRGYMRGEVYPFSIRFLLDNGQETANFILPNRPPTPYDLELVSNQDTDSINAYAPECSEELRDRRWQFYNTSEILGLCENEGGNFTEVVRTVRKICVIDNISTLPNYTYSIPAGVSFYGTEAYVNTYQTEICEEGNVQYDAGLCSLLSNEFPDIHCEPLGGCSDPVFVESMMSVGGVTGETSTIIYKPLEEYEPSPVQVSGIIWQSGEDGYAVDTNFTEQYLSVSGGEQAFIRLDFGGGSTCTGAVTLNELILNNTTDIIQYGAGNTAAELQTSEPSCPSTGFLPNIHIGAKWYKASIPSEGLILEVAASPECTSPDAVSIGETLRYTLYDGCGGGLVSCGNFDPSVGLMEEVSLVDFPSGQVVMVVDAPYIERVVDTVNGSETVFMITPPCTGMIANVRSVENNGLSVNVGTLSLNKTERYDVQCTYKIPDFGLCETLPHEYGTFGYYESLDKYPCNSELYDSSGLVIARDEVPDSIRTEFESNYVGAVTGGVYTLNEDTDLQDKPIRHYRFPDNCQVPFMNTETLLPFQESYIYPMGVSLDNEVVNWLLDVAVSNGLITTEQRASITQYELYRGDRRLDRSILAKGLAYDIYKYEEGGEDWHYPNYPYNDLGEDRYNFLDDGRGELIPHPYVGIGNDKFTFHSPDTHFHKPTLPPEVHFEGYQMGNSRGRFVDVEDHSEWVVLGNGGYILATALGAAEAAFELAIITGNAWIEAAKTYHVGTVFNPVGVGMSTGFAWAITGAAFAASGFFKVGEYRYKWLKILRENGRSVNFAKYYASEGWYNKFLPNCDEGNMIRGLAASKYIKPGNYKINDSLTGNTTTLNNFQRESSVYLSTSEDFLVNYDPEYIGYDNNVENFADASRFTSSEAGVCADKRSDEVTRNIGSPYVSLRRWLPRQYGTVSSIRWLTTSYCGKLSEDSKCEVIFGGDVFLSRMSLKRKLPFFYSNAIGLANFTPFEYYSQRNIGYPRFYADYATSERGGLAQAIFPDIGDDFVFDCSTGLNRVYVREPNHFYLFSYGIPQFLVESEINLNYRYARKEYHEQFYPNVGDYVDWTQDVNVSIKEDNTYHYNNAYSKQVSQLGTRILPDSYDKEKYDCLYDAPNGVVYSRQDVSEQDLSDPWLVYRPLDFYQFPTTMGRVVDLRGIESSQVLVRFENGVTLFNAVDRLRDRLTPENYLLGNGGIFASRPLESNLTDLGYGGTQHRAMVSCEFGHFWVDAKRGGVFQVDPNGGNLREITQGIRQWFKNHLPFKIMREGITGLTYDDLDNNYKGLGIAMAWDSRYQRVFLTKKDKVLNPIYRGRVSYIDGEFVLDRNTLLDITNPAHFQDASFTLAYSPLLEAWISYYTFRPDYYVATYNHFKTGVNYPYEGEQGLWSHLLTNKSYQVFYGKRYGWLVELPIKENMSPRVLDVVRYWLDTRRYHNDYDYAEYRQVGFNKAWIYNKSQNTGQLNLVPHKEGNLQHSLIYPRVVSNYEEEILATEQDMRWSFNDLRNRVRDELTNVPIWYWDVNQIDKVLNPQSLYYNRPLSERLRGDWLLLRLVQDADSRFKQIFKWSEDKSRVYD